LSFPGLTVTINTLIREESFLSQYRNCIEKRLKYGLASKKEYEEFTGVENSIT
jgi:hypothetical protein